MPNRDFERLREITVFVAACRRTRALRDLSTLIDAAVRQFGFRWFALVHNIDLAQHPSDALMLTTYPAAWQEEVYEKRLYADDPAHLASARSVLGLSWDRIPDQIVLSARQRRTLQRARSHGLEAGFTLQIRMPGEPSGVFSIARRGQLELSDEEELTAKLVGVAAFEQARFLMGDKRKPRTKVALSPRHIDCITLVAKGKSDWDIAQILGLSRDTVHEYIESARRRYGVQRRTQLVLRASEDGYLTYDAAF